MLSVSNDREPAALIHCQRGDIPFLLELARETYPSFDERAASIWLDKVLPRADSLVLRSASAAIVAMVGAPSWMPSDRQCHIIFVLGYPRAVWDVVRLLRASQEWALEMGCGLWRFGADVPFDVGPLARRVGASEDSPRYYRALRGQG